MIIQVVAGEVGKGGGFEIDLRQAVLIEGMAAGFNDHILCAVFYHLLLSGGDCQTIRRGQCSFAAATGAGIVNNSADKAAFFAGLPDAGANKKCDRGLSVRPCDGKIC